MKKYFNCFNIILFVFLCFTANAQFNIPPGAPIDVYVAGYTDNYPNLIATIWKNGVPQYLGLGTATSVFVSGNDVYAAGTVPADNYSFNAVLWKNGVMQNLGEGIARSVFIYGSDAYVAGSVVTENYTSYAVLWKNGIVQNLGLGEAISVFVSGSDVYVAGYVAGHLGNASATVWKNGVPQNLGMGGASSVFVSGNDVYVAGSTGDHPNSTATLWKNGIAQNLGRGHASSVFVYGSDVYITGGEGGSDYISTIFWRNGVRQVFGEYDGGGNSIFVYGHDVYIAGSIYGQPLRLNGVSQGPEGAQSVFIVQRETDHSFPSAFIGTWRRANFNNTLTAAGDTIIISSRTHTWKLLGIFGDVYTLKRDGANQFQITIQLVNGNLVISGDTGTGQENWNGTWLRQ